MNRTKSFYRSAKEVAREMSNSVATKVGGASAVLFATGSQAAISLPTTETMADIALVVVFVSLVGGALLGLHYLAKSFGWAKKAG